MQIEVALITQVMSDGHGYTGIIASRSLSFHSSSMGHCHSLIILLSTHGQKKKGTFDSSSKAQQLLQRVDLVEVVRIT